MKAADKGPERRVDVGEQGAVGEAGSCRRPGLGRRGVLILVEVKEELLMKKGVPSQCGSVG